MIIIQSETDNLSPKWVETRGVYVIAESENNNLIARYVGSSIGRSLTVLMNDIGDTATHGIVVMCKDYALFKLRKFVVLIEPSLTPSTNVLASLLSFSVHCSFSFGIIVTLQ